MIKQGTLFPLKSILLHPAIKFASFV